MFCTKCGAQQPDDARFCDKCGASLGVVETPKQSQQNFIASFKQYKHFIAVGVAVIALIFAIITLFNLFDVSATISVNDRSTSESGPVADLIDQDRYGSILVGNIFFGLLLVASAAVGGLFFAKKYGIKIYDSLTKIPFVTEDSPFFAMGALAAVGAFFQFILYLFAGESKEMFGVEYSTSISVPWFTWVIFILFAGIAVADFLRVKKGIKL